jgi:FtsP/CotA-like multicopper oxidase with cupredoxin domain
MKISRRDALKFGGLAAVGAAGLTLPLGRSVNAGTPSLLSSGNFPKRFVNPFQRLEVLPRTSTKVVDGKTVDCYTITAQPGTASILPNKLGTPILGYEGRVPARRIDVERGTPIEMTMRNQLLSPHPIYGKPVHISTHLHGSASLPQYDGYASDITGPKQSKTYRYPNEQPARTLWYHDHGVHWTAQNAYSGLASQYHMHDAEERGLLPTYRANDPQSEFDVAMTLSDMMFKANGTQLYDDRSTSGLWGDVILVNGVPWPVMKVKRRVYRFRVLNASLSRSYRLNLSNSAPMHMVATDGGMMPKTQATTSYRHAPAERYEFLIDFTKFGSMKAGTRIELRNASNDNNRDYDYTGKIMAFELTDDAFDTSGPSATTIPVDLATGNEVMKLKAEDSTKTRRIRVKKSDTTGLWGLNDETWEDVIKSGYKKVIANPKLGATEIWEIENSSGGWFHPLHIHLVDFKVLSRNGRAAFNYEQGPKDVVYIGEGETVRLLMKFGPHKGKYMVHCHNLPHEDHDMMHQFSVGIDDPDAWDPNDPIGADKPYDG